ncbi:peroxisomal Multifunctional enzyme type 2 [Tachypleus tridentatus]|uniref:peroxisomal Multifunctional enzyme type 2 n=1 Tax=Tachypleus tridentatus TaxID=6853 RepID=UPI003FD3E8E9
MADNKMSEMRFDGKVAVVTGAGGGLGREYAISLADRGASVVVNDLGGTRSGQGKNTGAADKVVQEIISRGGKAVADYNSVEEGEKVIQTAIDKFGHIDILINNAGILRDKSFMKLSVEDWEIVLKVHLQGSFLVTKAAWPYLREQKYGRIIMTSSGAGIYGNFGQANYSAAKLGLLGLSNTLAVEGKKYGIHCNTVIPLAGSRLTEDILPPEFFDKLKPEYVSPLVVWLCHESCPETGGVFEAAGSWIGKYQWQRSVGKAFLPANEKLTAESIRDNWNLITDMSNCNTPSSVQEQMGLLVEALTGNVTDQRKQKESQQSSKDNEGYSYSYNDVILYALGVGMSTKDPDHLKFLYEGSEDFSVLPTFGCIPAMKAVFRSEALQKEIQRLKVDPTKMVHGEQYLEILKPFPPEGVLNSVVEVIDVLDKGSGALVVLDVNTFNDAGEKVMYSQWSVFFIGAGNFGGKRDSDKIKSIISPPNRKPDCFVTEKTSVDQAALYRLMGDGNPLHIDPSFAAMGGFPQPIMHGLCTFGYAARHALKQFAGNDVTKLEKIKARFAGPLIPGESIQTQMWKEGNRIHFQCIVEETGKVIISGGYVDLNDPVISVKSHSDVHTELPATINSDMVFKELGKRLGEMPDAAAKVQAIFEWNITKNGKPAAQWTLDLKNGKGEVYRGSPKNEKAGCILTLEDSDMVSMVTGKLDPQKAFMSGKLKIKGNIMLTQKLRTLLKAAERENPTPEQKNLKSKEDTEESKPTQELKSTAVFEAVARKLSENPDLVSSVNTVYQWNITKDGQEVGRWITDLKHGKGSVYQGEAKQGKADCILTMDDDILDKLVTGKLDPQKAFMTGKLKISGDIMASQKLQDLWEKDEERENQKSKTTKPRLKSTAVFEAVARKLSENPDLVSSVNTVYQWNITKDGQEVGRWITDLKHGKGSVYQGEVKEGKADCILTMDDDILDKLVTGKLDPQKAFMTGKLKISGDIMASQKLQDLWEKDEERENQKSKTTKPKLTKFTEPLLGLKSELIFNIFAERIPEEPELAKKIKVVFHWIILKQGKKSAEWTVDLKTAEGHIYRGPPKQKPDCSITLEDEDLIKLMLGKMNPQRAFMTGRLKLQGNIMLTQRMNKLWQEIIKSGRAVELPLVAPILSEEKPLRTDIKSDYIFLDFAKRVGRTPAIVTKTQTVYEWNILKNGSPTAQWTTDLKNGFGAIYRGPPKTGKADCTLTLEDSDLTEIVAGGMDPKKAITARKLEVSGNIALAEKLQNLISPQAKL